MTTIDTAARQYATRPKDERYPSLGALLDHAQHVKSLSAERAYNLKDLAVLPSASDLRLMSPKGTAQFTHWSFGQLARMVGAPAGYLRSLPPMIAADCLNAGLAAAVPGTTANVLVQAENGAPEPTIRACTSDSYGRLWDADLYGAVSQTIVDRDDRWSLPPTWSGEPAGAYSGDRDSFLILTNGGSIVTDPSAGDSGQMYRGLLIRNSEVGASSVVLEQILYRYVCGNHMLWGAMVDKTFRRRHFGAHVLRDTVREIASIAYRWTQASPARDEAIIRALIDHEIAHTQEAVIDELRALGASQEQARAAYASCVATESVSPRSFWGTVQGLTRVAQEAAHNDERYELDRIAANVLARGRKLVAA